MRDVSKWAYAGDHITRSITTRPFGFTRVRTETQKVPATILDVSKYVRALNGEPEPEVKLDDLYSSSFLWAHHGPYRFSTAALKAELARREELLPLVSAVARQGVAGIFEAAWGFGATSKVDRRTTERRKAVKKARKGKKP